MASVELDKAPRALRESLLFPYQDGEKWVNALYKRGGWNEVSQAFTTLPQSTEQVLHPEKYFAHEAPEKLNLADVRSQLGPKWKRIDYDVNGEWSYYLILDQFLNSEVESKRAAAGWAGDRYAVYEAPATDDVFITQLSVWDTENEAREFFDAYAKRTKLRYADSKAAELAASGERRQWTTSQGGVAMEMKGKRILILEGIPGNTDVNELLRALWQ